MTVARCYTITFQHTLDEDENSQLKCVNRFRQLTHNWLHRVRVHIRSRDPAHKRMRTLTSLPPCATRQQHVDVFRKVLLKDVVLHP